MHGYSIHLRYEIAENYVSVTSYYDIAQQKDKLQRTVDGIPAATMNRHSLLQ